MIHKDVNGHTLERGDGIVLFEYLKVRGVNFIAKRGTVVRNITLVHDNVNRVEGRIYVQHIVMLTQNVKKT